MYDNELSVALQMERERAIREARLHHRADLPMPDPKLQRLRSAAASLVRAVARRGVPDATPSPTTAIQPGRSSSGSGARASGS